jgi:nitrous oxide reductase accessory protein NosL
MKRKYFFTAAAMFCLAFAAVSHARIHEDIRLQKNCKICGMDRQEFGYSRVLIEYDDGIMVGTCSTRCAALDLAMNIGRVPRSIKAGEFNSGELIDAEKAYWVVGGKKEGVMSMRGKWAFQKKSGAEGFMAKNGGKLGTFQDALKASFEDLYKDLKMFWDSMKKPNR